MPYKITYRRIANTSLPYLIPYHSATRGHNMRFRPLLSSRINCHQSPFFPRSIIIWNAPPAYMVQMETALQPFCRKVNFTCFYYWHPFQHQVWKYSLIRGVHFIGGGRRYGRRTTRARGEMGGGGGGGGWGGREKKNERIRRGREGRREDGQWIRARDYCDYFGEELAKKKMVLPMRSMWLRYLKKV